MRYEPAGAIGVNLGKKKPGAKSVRVANISRMVAARVRICRELRGMAQEDLEHAAGLSKGYSSRIESGERGRALSIDVVVRCARGLRVDLMWLITGQGRSPFGISEHDEKQQALQFGALASPSKTSAPSRAQKSPGKASPQLPPKPRSPAVRQPKPSPRLPAHTGGDPPARAKSPKPRKR